LCEIVAERCWLPGSSCCCWPAKALALPDESDNATFVAGFYADHRATIIALQLVGLAAAGLLAGYAARLRAVDADVGATGAVTALLACAPGLATIVLALVADPSAPARAGAWNQRLPRADDLLFLGIIVFGLAVAIRLRSHRVDAVVGGLTALLYVARLGLEAAGRPRGVLDSLGPIAFLLLIASLAAMSWRGLLSTGPEPR
jgi:hypothetical protein